VLTHWVRMRGMLTIILVAATSWMGTQRAEAHDPAADMVQAANNFIVSLDDEAKKAALFEFSDDKRQFWHFVPDKYIKPGGKRYGLLVEKMTPRQRLLAFALLSSAMTHKGYSQSLTIMTLEQILHEMEKKNPIRNPQLYYVSIFGKPSTTETWGWKVEGHHLSLNCTVVKGKHFSVTPSFFGTNPGTVKSGPAKGLKVLSAEEDMARALVKSLSDEQKKKAIIAAKAPSDVITKQDRKADKGKFMPIKGISFDELNDAQKAQLLKVIHEYSSKYRPEIIAEIDGRKKIADGKGIYFAWAGGMELGDGHYYRIQTPLFLFEYDSTQNGANHVHAVWRDFDGDFGEDLLKKHYDKAHKAK
jgi:hypothetical protein